MRRERRISRVLLESYRGDGSRDSRSSVARSPGSLECLFPGSSAARLVVVSLATLVASIASNPMVGAAVPIIAWGAIRWLRARRARRVTALLERDLPPLLTSIAASVRAGIDPLRALSDAAEQFPDESPLRHELCTFRAGLAKGGDEVELVGALCATYDHPDIELFKRCLVLSRAHGSSLADPLHRVVRVVRQRQSFRRKTRAALAMHRMSAIGIAGCAALIGVMQMTVNRKGIQTTIANPTGALFLVAGASLVGLGVAWMLSMGREEKL